MKFKLLPFTLLALFIALTSASFTSVQLAETKKETQTTTIVANEQGNSNVQKLTFFQKLYQNLFLKKQAERDEVKADKLAKTALGLGIGAASLLVVGLFVPYVILGSIPLGIAAMITGSGAVRQNTTLIGKAKTGKALGLGTLIAFGVLLIAAAVVVAAWASIW